MSIKTITPIVLLFAAALAQAEPLYFEALVELDVADDLLDLVRHDGGVAGLDDDAAGVPGLLVISDDQVLDDGAHGADVGAHRGDAGSHGLQGDDRQALVVAGQDEQVELGQELADLDGPADGDVIRENILK